MFTNQYEFLLYNGCVAVREYVLADCASSAWVSVAELAGRRTQMITKIKMLSYNRVRVSVERSNKPANCDIGKEDT